MKKIVLISLTFTLYLSTFAFCSSGQERYLSANDFFKRTVNHAAILRCYMNNLSEHIDSNIGRNIHINEEYARNLTNFCMSFRSRYSILETLCESLIRFDSSYTMAVNQLKKELHEYFFQKFNQNLLRDLPENSWQVRKNGIIVIANFIFQNDELTNKLSRLSQINRRACRKLLFE